MDNKNKKSFGALFYEADEINEQLICPCCKNKYNDPRVVECGASFCMSCIELLTKNGENGFKCPVCDDYHILPNQGWYKNLNLGKICEKKAAGVSRGPQADTLSHQLDELKLKLDDFTSERSFSEEKINEYCNKLRNEVQLSTDELLKSINILNARLIEQIDTYERNSKLDFEKKDKTRLNQLSLESYEFHSKWTEYLKELKLDDLQLKSASNKAALKTAQVNNEAEQFLNNLFNNSLLTFKKSNASLLSSSIGCLSYANAKKSGHDLKIVNLNSHFLDDCVDFVGLLHTFYFKVLHSQDICLAYPYNNDKYVQILMFDRCFELSTEKRLELEYDCARFEIAELEKSIAFCFIERKADACSRIESFDFNLKSKKKELTFSYAIDAIDGYGNNVYIATRTIKEEEWYLTVNILDENLVLLKSIQQSDLKRPFANPLKIKNLKVAEKFFVFLVGAEIVVMNRKTRKMSKRFHIAESKIMLNGSKNGILAYDSKRNELVSYDFQGGLQSFKLNGIRNTVELVDCSNEKFFFYDSLLDCLYF